MKLVDRLLYFVFYPIMRHIVVLSAKDAADVLSKTRHLRREGFLTSFDVMVEDVGDSKLIGLLQKFHSELISLMEKGDYGNIVIKPTSLGLDASDPPLRTSDERFVRELWALLLSISLRNQGDQGETVELEIDAESTQTIERAFRVIAGITSESPELRYLLRIAVPMHLKELPNLCRTYGLLEHPIRIVKGAGVYREDPNVLVDVKTVERRYKKYFIDCLERKKRPYIATMHDEKLLRRVLQSAHDHGIEKNEFVIQMLYGLWTGLGRRLLDEGYTVCVYVPVVLPWCKGASGGYIQRRISIFRTLFWKWLTTRTRNHY
ncbi:MAG: hypothetical protein A2845_04585 [Candidatus Lloydbacteria bacterium RIFCSPHIGHO2_01_FULL_49_22]|uniref:Proline dehydrogenase domain-containing protein n=1 Tax=Candidatus Lloydbacteria bacterium RIFCSPHIGHO2_01_FULL_49_22 TaxID=1798658 RepID=A0A1G2CY45_9BACT|nr:MAG: hypothetical protein A2845_04585 [Candidatus Lloydbacteria bacterium RIFCSPHIGHO2_01_FULL_49_22]OGZ10094.1 MAG: hypothetical protein A3C14_00620 [Candidatus Lloydbacteria bacterium RIFCSPHIGHO2_02_FULL_50_18]